METPKIEELKSFWINFWSHENSYFKKAFWIENIKGTYKKYVERSSNKIDPKYT